MIVVGRKKLILFNNIFSVKFLIYWYADTTLAHSKSLATFPDRSTFGEVEMLQVDENISEEAATDPSGLLRGGMQLRKHNRNHHLPLSLFHLLNNVTYFGMYIS